MAPFINGVKVANRVVHDVASNARRDRAGVSISRERDPRVRVGEARIAAETPSSAILSVTGRKNVNSANSSSC